MTKNREKKGKHRETMFWKQEDQAGRRKQEAREEAGGEIVFF